MEHRRQRTIRTAVEVGGIGFLTGADVALRFLPAPADHGIVFRRVDCPGQPLIPARIEFAVPRERRTAIERHGAVVEMVEHVLAALAGLRVDNCLVEVNAPEPPGLDGSCRGFADALLAAGIVELNRLRPVLMVERPLRIGGPDQASQIEAMPLNRPVLAITYQLDYGPKSPIRPQQLTVEVTPETFLSELVFARTFVLESEVASLRAQGYGRRTTHRDLLVFGPNGVIGNHLHVPDECARHKLLDCLGDLALAGCDVCGHIRAYRSGHGLNREIARRLLQTSAHSAPGVSSRRAA